MVTVVSSPRAPAVPASDPSWEDRYRDGNRIFPACRLKRPATRTRPGCERTAENPAPATGGYRRPQSWQRARRFPEAAHPITFGETRRVAVNIGDGRLPGRILFDALPRRAGQPATTRISPIRRQARGLTAKGEARCREALVNHADCNRPIPAANVIGAAMFIVMPPRAGGPSAARTSTLPRRPCPDQPSRPGDHQVVVGNGLLRAGHGGHTVAQSNSTGCAAQRGVVCCSTRSRRRWSHQSVAAQRT